MSVIDQIRRKAKERLMRVVLPEGDEPRTVEAAAEVAREGLARPILLGDPQKVAAAAAASRMIPPASIPSSFVIRILIKAPS